MKTKLLTTSVAACFFVMSLMMSCKYIFKMNSEGMPLDTGVFSKAIPKQFLELLKMPEICCKNENDSIFFINTVKNKYRSPISMFFMDKNFYLQMYEMDSLVEKPMNQLIKESFTDAECDTYYTPFEEDRLTDMQFLFKATKPEKPSNIFLDIYGDSTTSSFKNDTVAYFYSKCRNFSIKVNPLHKNDICGECKSHYYSEVPLEILFFRKKKALYLLMLSSISAQVPLDRNALYNLIINHNWGNVSKRLVAK